MTSQTSQMLAELIVRLEAAIPDRWRGRKPLTRGRSKRVRKKDTLKQTRSLNPHRPFKKHVPALVHQRPQRKPYRASTW